MATTTVVLTDENLSFTCPAISPKYYITRGPSGHTETFKRKELDDGLCQYLAPAPVNDMVNLFISTRELSENKEPTSWHTITGFLGRTIGTTPRAIPPMVGIAFWAHVVIEMASRDAN